MTDSFSLWLVPEGESAVQLSHAISILAARLGGPCFAPHLTLVGGFPGTPTQRRPQVEQLAPLLSPVPIDLDGPEGSASYFRCLYLRAGLSSPLTRAHEVAREALDIEPGSYTAFLPHVSLFYGHLSPAAHEQARAICADLSLPGAIIAARAELWSTQGAPESWSRLAAWDLVP